MLIAIRELSGRKYGDFSLIDSVVINKKYLLYLVNESNMITKLFDTGFACDGTQ